MDSLHRLMVSAALAGGMLACAVPASAQTAVTVPQSAREQHYPNKPVRLITGTPGSVPDIVSRQIGQQLSERWGQPVVVENRAGAGGTIAAAIAAKAVPDGYTLLMSDRTATAVAPSLYKGLPYVPARDLAPITLAAVTSFLLVAHPSFPAANLREFIGHARQRPGAINMGIAPPGTGSHIATELFKHMAGVNVVTVPYKSGANAIVAIVSGETKAGFNTIPTALPHVKTGRVKAYASSGVNRFAGTPDIPTVAEAGLPGYQSENWVGMFAPAGVPAPLIEKLNREMVEILQSPATRTVLLAQGAEPSPKTPADFAAYVRSETVKMKKVIELAGVRVE